MTHRDLKHIVSFSLCAAALFLGSTIYYAARAGRYEQYAALSGQRAAAQLIGSVESMQTVMEALPYTAGTNLFPQTAAQLSQYASAASAALAALNLEEAHLLRTGQYINQAGDLARALLVQHLAGFPLEPDQQQQLEQVCHGMTGLLDGLRDVKARLNAGDLSHGDFGAGDSGLTSAMAKLEALAPEAGLRYDGAFSLPTEVSSPLLNGLPRLGTEELAQRAAKLAGRSLPLLAETSSPIPALCFGDENFSISLTLQGGKLLRWLRDEPEGEPVLTESDALDAAARFLQQQGYGELQHHESRTDGDWCISTWAPMENGVVLLPDAVTVTVSLVNGDILSLDARDYLLYHSLRQFAEDPLTAAEAQSRLPEGLKADQGHMTLVRSPGGKELLCYAFLCETPEGDALRILVRADNGALWELLPQPGR